MSRLILTAFLGLCGPVYATAQVTGRWTTESTPPGTTWTAVLRQDGPRVIGAISSCASLQGSGREITGGVVDGEMIGFECTSSGRQITFRGEQRGDQINFTWQLQQQPGDFPIPESDRIFGAGAPRHFTARRVSDIADGLQAMADRARKGPAVSFDRLLRADAEPQNWLTYSGNLLGHRHSTLTDLTPANVKGLELAWLWQSESAPGGFQATPLVVDGVIYTVQAPNDVIALDAGTGRVIWTYRYAPPLTARVAGHVSNRGLAISGDTLFLGTLDAHLIAIDAYSGHLKWNTVVANAADPACQLGRCYGITHAPLVVKNKVIVGVAGGDDDRAGFGIRGFIAAYEADSGKEVWRFYTVAAPDQAGGWTWAGDSWKTGGAGIWVTGVYDAEQNMTFWGTGNPAPPRSGATRAGDNLYSNSVVALDADTGQLRWHYQFTPHDDLDWDSAQVPIVVDLDWRGRRRKVLLWANRNGIAYVLDRVTGEFLAGRPFVEVNWLTGFDDRGRPLRAVDKTSTAKALILPGDATNWYSSSYSPATGLFYIPAWERGSMGGVKVRGPGYGAIRAFDPTTGERKWEFKRNDALFSAGILTTSSNLLFTGVSGDVYSDRSAARLADGYFYALDARTGEPLWSLRLPDGVQSAPITFSIGGQQYVAVCAGNTLFAFALRR